MFFFFQLFSQLKFGFIGDSRVRRLKEHAPYYVSVTYDACKPSWSTARWLQEDDLRLPADLDVVVIHLMQCDLTVLDRHRNVIPNPDFSLEDLLTNVRRIQYVYATRYPNTIFIWTVPIVPNFYSGVSREQCHCFQNRLRQIVSYLRHHMYYVFDLALSFRSGERRRANPRVSGDGIHFSKQVVLRYFKQLRMLLLTRGTLYRIFCSNNINFEGMEGRLPYQVIAPNTSVEALNIGTECDP